MAPTIERGGFADDRGHRHLGALGALARYGLEGVVSRRLPTSFPWGTFVVNVSGALVLGFLLTLMTEQLTTAPWLRSALTIGFLGAYTTFSTLQYEPYRLLEDGALGSPPRTSSAARPPVSSPSTSESW
jgi:CrcB protein